MNIDLDIDADLEQFIDPDFWNNIEGINSKAIFKKISYPNPLHTFKFNCGLKAILVNTARFMMEGMGYSPKYWLCTGFNTLNTIMQYNMDHENNYNKLIEVSCRKDVLCLHGLPLFFVSESDLGDCLLMVSDIKKTQVRVSCFMDSGIDKKRKKKPPEPRSKKYMVKPKKRAKNFGDFLMVADEDDKDEDYTIDLDALDEDIPF